MAFPTGKHNPDGDRPYTTVGSVKSRVHQKTLKQPSLSMEKKRLPEFGGGVVIYLQPLNLHGLPVRTGSALEVSSPV